MVLSTSHRVCYLIPITALGDGSCNYPLFPNEEIEASKRGRVPFPGLRSVTELGREAYLNPELLTSAPSSSHDTLQAETSLSVFLRAPSPHAYDIIGMVPIVYSKPQEECWESVVSLRCGDFQNFWNAHVLGWILLNPSWWYAYHTTYWEIVFVFCNGPYWFSYRGQNTYWT